MSEDNNPRRHDPGKSPLRESDQGDAAVLEGKPKLAPPKRYNVLIHNDDYTTMDFVVEVLQKFFQKNEEQAVQVMMSVHHEGKGVAGVYSREIAEMKVAQVEDYSRAHEHPLKCTCEPE